ncbi:MAG: diacylglycerol kinase family lipid kinase, partial [Clostridia bacterium]|nr:diacylglycerol kinase family lipid kinase [Clostridia bacterium]
MYHVIYNPTAQAGNNRHILERVEARLKEVNAKYELHPTSYAGHAEALAREYTNTADMGASDFAEIIVIGGDGTIHEVLNGLCDPARVRLAIVPAGTGNDFVAAAGIPQSVEKVMDIVLQRRAKNTDYIVTGDRRCMNVGGLGMDVEVVERVAQGTMKGRIKYLLSLISCVFTFKGYRMQIEMNGETREVNALFAAVCNGSQFGGGIRICPGAKVDDGKLELIVVPQMGFFGIIRAFASLMAGKILKFPTTEHYYCDSVKIIPDKVRTVQLDGELYAANAVFDCKVASGL